MKKATTLSILRRIAAIIIFVIASSSSHAFLIGTQHLNNNYSPCSGITTSSSLAETQRDEENAAVDNHRRTLLLLTSLCSCYQPAISCADDNDDNSIVSTPSLPSEMISARIQGIHDPNLQNYVNPLLPHWKGTALPGPLSLSEAYSQFIRPSVSSTADDYYNTAVVKKTTTVFPMGKWPDPILRIPSSPIPSSTFQNKSQLQMLQSVADTLRNTARNEGAVGLAAQQCGIDASLIFVDGVVLADTASSSSSASSSASDASQLGGIFGQSNWRNSKKQLTGEGVLPVAVDNYSLLPTRRVRKQQPPKSEQGIFLVNPRIIHRSPESEMLVWTEECLVLPPEFRATLLRDAEITIEYETLTTGTTTAAAGSSGTEECSSCGETKQITLRGELARCAQHEMDHDRGVLIVDHVGMEELLSINGQSVMEDVENSDGRHAERMQRAYARDVADSVLLPSVKTHRNVDLAFGSRDDFLARKVDCFAESDLDGTARVVRHSSSTRHPWFVSSANALESDTNTNYSASSSRSSSNAPNTRPDNSDNGTSTSSSCDDACLADRKRRIQERRAMMQQSRSATNRGDVLELSRQRALMYGTSYKGLSPETCSQPGFCP